MPEWKELVRRQLAELCLTPEREAEIAEELAEHAEDRYKELQLSGVSDAEARRLTLNEVLGSLVCVFRCQTSFQSHLGTFDLAET